MVETSASRFSDRKQYRGPEPDQAIAWIYGIAHHQLSRWFRRGAVEWRALAKLGVDVPGIIDTGGVFHRFPLRGPDNCNPAPKRDQVYWGMQSGPMRGASQFVV